MIVPFKAKIFIDNYIYFISKQMYKYFNSIYYNTNNIDNLFSAFQKYRCFQSLFSCSIIPCFLCIIQSLIDLSDSFCFGSYFLFSHCFLPFFCFMQQLQTIDSSKFLFLLTYPVINCIFIYHCLLFMPLFL